MGVRGCDGRGRGNACRRAGGQAFLRLYLLLACLQYAVPGSIGGGGGGGERGDVTSLTGSGHLKLLHSYKIQCQSPSCMHPSKRIPKTRGRERKKVQGSRQASHPRITGQQQPGTQQCRGTAVRSCGVVYQLNCQGRR